MPIFNVKVSVVDLVAATDATAAIRSLLSRLNQAGFDVYDNDPADAFESETLPADLAASIEREG